MAFDTFASEPVSNSTATLAPPLKSPIFVESRAFTDQLYRSGNFLIEIIRNLIDSFHKLFTKVVDMFKSIFKSVRDLFVTKSKKLIGLNSRLSNQLAGLAKMFIEGSAKVVDNAHTKTETMLESLRETIERMAGSSDT